jgi:predicted Ser/Thr protein kinase
VKNISHAHRDPQAPFLHSRLRLEAVYKLHRFGIRHCGLDKEENFVVHGGKVYITGFSEAKTRCGCEMTRDRVRMCTELKRMEQQFGDGGTNKVLKEIGVPPGWRVCLE